ncbi:uncharacterized protein LOC133725264 [Rosa rugosa]|uniref:uncharacterized protein LOC133725264 n=1 Tax=Rosa rugosa TaxID=74645 RepID=UPI002B4166C3|nr:uncharacterized protein LOC133725264 [Rosa rugosa]
MSTSFSGLPILLQSSYVKLSEQILVETLRVECKDEVVEKEKIRMKDERIQHISSPSLISMKRLWAKYRQSRDEDHEEMCTTNALVVAVVAEAEASSQTRRGGSRPGRAPNEERFRESRGKNMMEYYFVECPVFSEKEFRTRYRMSHNVFNRISSDLCRYDRYFVQKSDAAKKVGLLPQRKLTCSLRMLAYGAGADQCFEYCRMAKSTAIEALKRFTRGIVNLYSAEYLRAPTPADLRRLLAKAERRAIASYAFFGMPGSCNDFNVLAKSPLFDELIAGRAPQIQFQVNNRIHNLGYYLADGSYPQWATFVKLIPRPTRPKDLKFSQVQEGYRKDVERCFGILQSRFSIVRGAARGWDREDLRYIMLTCIILHNMIIEDEKPDDSDEDLESDEEEDNNMRPRFGKDRPVMTLILLVEMVIISTDSWIDTMPIRSANSHSNLQEDMIEHFWNIQGNLEI